MSVGLLWITASKEEKGEVLAVVLGWILGWIKGYSFKVHIHSWMLHFSFHVVPFLKRCFSSWSKLKCYEDRDCFRQNGQKRYFWIKTLDRKNFFFFFNSCFHFNPAKIFKILLFSFGSHTALIPHVHLCATSNAVSAGECLSGNTIA